MENKQTPPVYALEIKDLKKTYKGGVEAVKGISLAVEKGDFFALLGPNGAGKSTTIGVISSLVQKTSGSVSVFEHDIDKQLELAKLSIGLVPQEFNFNQFEKVLQIVVNQAGYYGVSRADALERAEKYLTQLDLWEKRDSPARTLSGGMKRRLMIARALMHEPQLLILDEPTAGVDIELRRSMWSFLTELNEQGVTIILTTHYLEEAEMLCRNIGIIDKGILVECTSMKSLLSRLNLETFILDLGSDLSDAPVLDGMECRLTDAHTLEIDVAKAQSINSVFAQLTEKGIEVLSMRNKANRLEELFVELVEKGSIEASKGVSMNKEASE
ncbi:ABC transporter ATP-binding protein [Shewanella eurypsychrophilus]|uniref:ABC transporter ATP-binding protein n=1 Tax=Shewanella eurypsychrophilus TaxID=2593656 RepID=A0ABX6V201_9GAMM|nr:MULTISPECIES: ABC transporter ATP-binding protein [Shewanella]QFU21361.1 ATP-binding cassette domain-containing protein [Shewanella sp. YLB-09]QPG56651.1 ABC transporter ATP-binding protein [Shewanella eurypsychrophilus]